MTATDALYHALILDHDRAPRNCGELPGATHSATLDNPLCGDIVTIHLVVDDGRADAGGGIASITRATFEARGCALCRAAASMLTERVANATVAEVRELSSRFEAFVSGTVDGAELGDLVSFRGVQAVKARRTCATLPVRALLVALRDR